MKCWKSKRRMEIFRYAESGIEVGIHNLSIADMLEIAKNPISEVSSLQCLD